MWRLTSTSNLHFAEVFVAVRNALKKAAYRGWLGAEYRPEGGDTGASLGWMTAWRSVDQG